jgi:MFS family permease
MMHLEFSVPVSYAGGISLIIAIGTVISSLLSDRLSRWLGTAKLTAFSAALTALAIFGFSVSHSYWVLCLWAIPYGLGAGSVDASLNNYVAVHYASRHMSWLHCMWALGASIGPYIMGAALSGGMAWNRGYLAISVIQAVLTLTVFLSLPLWKKTGSEAGSGGPSKALTLKQIRQSDTEKTKAVFGDFCPDWSQQQWEATENIVSGIEYATIMTDEADIPLAVQIEKALNSILLLYGVPENLRHEKIQKVLSMDYRALGRKILTDFKQYMSEVNEQKLASE